jgi:hypothetical protein
MPYGNQSRQNDHDSCATRIDTYRFLLPNLDFRMVNVLPVDCKFAAETFRLFFSGRLNWNHGLWEIAIVSLFKEIDQGE